MGLVRTTAENVNEDRLANLTWRSKDPAPIILLYILPTTPGPQIPGGGLCSREEGGYVVACVHLCKTSLWKMIRGPLDLGVDSYI